jgi:hypothetical protein
MRERSSLRVEGVARFDGLALEQASGAVFVSSISLGWQRVKYGFWSCMPKQSGPLFLAIS